MVFQDKRNNFSCDKVTPKGKDLQPFPTELRHAQFYYLDKFIIVASANKLFLYLHYLDGTKNDLQRYKTASRYKLVKEYEVEDVQVSASGIHITQGLQSGADFQKFARIKFLGSR